MDEASPQERAASGTRLPRNGRPLRVLLLALGVGAVAALIAANDVGDVMHAFARARLRALVVIAAHLPETFCAAVAWGVLLNRAQRPTWTALFRLRLIKEAVNALLPVAQIGGDVVRARLAAGPRLLLRDSAASCIVDIGMGTASLALFILSGIAVSTATTENPAVARLGVQLMTGGVLFTAALALAERLGALHLIDRAAARSEGALGHLNGVGQAVKTLLRQPGRVLHSMAWHLVSWGLGAFETVAALWALGLDTSLDRAFVLEALVQGVRALGFAIPGALGVQEGGYVLICASLGIHADQALALALLRRVRELVLGAIGLAAWRAAARTGRKGS